MCLANFKVELLFLKISIYLLIRKVVFLQIKFVMNIPTSARLTKERPMHRPISPPILEIKDSIEISYIAKALKWNISSVYLIQQILWQKWWWYKCLNFCKIFFTVYQNLFCKLSNIFCRHVRWIKNLFQRCDPVFVIKWNFILFRQVFPIAHNIFFLWKEVCIKMFCNLELNMINFWKWR